MSLKEKFKSTLKGSLSNDKYQLKQLNHILPNSELLDPIFALHQFQTKKFFYRESNPMVISKIQSTAMAYSYTKTVNAIGQIKYGLFF